MYFADTYAKILFLIIVCFSFLNFMLVISLNKVLSLFKLLGMAFFAPLFLCTYLFLFYDNLSSVSVVSLSEFYLVLSIMTVFIKANDERSYKVKAVIILVLPIISGLFVYNYKTSVFFALSQTGQALLTVAAAFGTAVLIKGQGYSERKLLTSLSIWSFGILLNVFELPGFQVAVLVTVKLAGYAAFFYYFYTTIHNSYTSKIVEYERLKDTLERSLKREIKNRVFEIERSNERLLEISKTDLLTKAYNKITILNIIERLINSKKESEFSILMFDIDNFKTINDSLGHVTGDLCLKTIANIASNNIREVDFLGRYGGDEFIIVLPSLSTNEARFVAERLRNKVSEASNPKFTISVGIATYPHDGRSVNELISVADRGLYKSKSKGKNMISHVAYF